MKRSIGLWQLMGFAITSLLGTLAHFLYDLTGGSPLAAPFSGVNESTFEHMKLLYFPMLLFALVESLHFRERGDFFCVKLRGTALGLTLIPVLFYTYNGAVGRSPDFLNIAIFFLSAALAYLYEAKQLLRKEKPCKGRLALVLLLLIGVLFIVFTWNPPKIGLFRDPITGSYGI